MLQMRPLWRAPLRLLRVWRSARLSALVTNKKNGARIVIADALMPVTVNMGKGASFSLQGRLTFEPWEGNRERTSISLGEGSRLDIDGDFNLGPGCRLVVTPGAHLWIGGRKRESASGMTERSIIMVRKRVAIGCDLLCAWGVFITDCDWHETSGSSNTEDTVVGEHVWITPNCSILKGSKIGDGCILATGSVTHRAFYPERSLLGGVPARVLAQGREWSRDLKAVAVC
jgi:acetyltransferase-like isoleucine patch superfamily enzyme